MTRLRSLWRNLLRRDRVERDLDDEIRMAFDLLVDDRVRRGMTLVDARRAATLEWGRIDNIKEQVRSVRAGAWLENAARDLRLAVRMLRRAPGVTLISVASLALGLAGTASTLVVMNAYLIRPLPYPAANRLYAVLYAPPGPVEPHGMTAIDWSLLHDVVELAATSSGDTFYLADSTSSESARGLRISSGFIQSLGLQPSLGRGFTSDEFRPGSENVAMLGDALWRDRFGADPTIVGRRLRTRTESDAGATESTLRIVGVLPPVFWYQYNRESPDIVVPLRAAARTYMVRLRQGVPVTDAERRITEEARRVGSSFPANWSGVHLESVHERYVTGLRPVLIATTIAAAIVLSIVCANVAVLMLLRTVRRQKELAVRLALGAGRGEIARMLAAETCVLCGAASIAALWITAVTLRGCAPFIEAHFERRAPGGLSVAALDPAALILIGSVSVLMAISLALIPMLPAWQRRLGDTLRCDGRSGTAGPATRRLQSILIAFEIAGSLALLVGCGLMIRSLVNMVRTDLGYDTAHVGYAHVVLPGRTYSSPSALMGFYDPLAERLSAVAGSSIALADFVPFVETPRRPVRTGDRVIAADTAGILAVNAGYFTTLGIEIARGRNFTAADRIESDPVALVSATLARRLWPNANPIGQRLSIGEPSNRDAPSPAWRTVVGVVRDVRQTYGDTDLRDVYLSFPQVPGRFASLYLRTEQPALSWLASVRGTIADIDPYVTINVSGALSDEDRQLAGTTFLSAILTGSAAFAVFLALLGMYGVTAYSTQQREREVAIRIALGATVDTIVRMFLKQGLIVLAAGLACGLLGAIVVARTLEHEIHGVRPFDLWTLAATCALMISTALPAIWIPARRAAIRSRTGLLNEN